MLPATRGTPITTGCRRPRNSAYRSFFRRGQLRDCVTGSRTSSRRGRTRVLTTIIGSQRKNCCLSNIPRNGRRSWQLLLLAFLCALGHSVVSYQKSQLRAGGQTCPRERPYERAGRVQECVRTSARSSVRLHLPTGGRVFGIGHRLGRVSAGVSARV